MRIAIAGSRRLPKGTATRLLNDLLRAMGGDDSILLRSPRGPKAPGDFEMEVTRLVGDISPYGKGRPVIVWRKPEPTEKHPGRASVYVRDHEMIGDSDRVVLFFTPKDAATGYSGTAHLLDKALDAGVPVVAYSVYPDGSVARIGEIDPE